MIKRLHFEKTVSKSVRLPESDIKFINELPGDDNFSEKLRKLLEIGMMFMDQPIPKVGDLVRYRGSNNPDNRNDIFKDKVFKVYDVAYGISLYCDLESDDNIGCVIDDIENFDIL